MGVATISGQAEFTLMYDGPAIQTGRMDVQDLAPALLAMGDLLQETNRVAYPGAAPIALEIRAFRPGSFIVQLNVASQLGNLVQEAINLLNAPGSIAGATLIAYVTAVMALAARLGRRRIERTDEPEPGTTRLTLDDQTVINVQTVIVNLYRNDVVRQRARAVVNPLTRPGIEEMTIVGPPSVEPLRIAKADVPSFEVPRLADSPILDQEVQMNLTITAVSFAEGNKWRLSDGDRTFFASIADDEFLARVERAEEAFRRGDLLHCQLRIQQWRTEAGLQTEYTVLRVIEHIPAARTLPLPFGEPNP